MDNQPGNRQRDGQEQPGPQAAGDKYPHFDFLSALFADPST